jgi:hypothetical protein
MGKSQKESHSGRPVAIRYIFMTPQSMKGNCHEMFTHVVT